MIHLNCIYLSHSNTSIIFDFVSNCALCPQNKERCSGQLWDNIPQSRKQSFLTNTWYWNPHIFIAERFIQRIYSNIDYRLCVQKPNWCYFPLDFFPKFNISWSVQPSISVCRYIIHLYNHIVITHLVSVISTQKQFL